MREAPHRQLFFRQNRRGALLSLFCCVALNPAHPMLAADTSPQGELRAAKIVATAVLSSTQTAKPGCEDLEKVARIYDGIIKRNPRSSDARMDYADFLWASSRRDEALAQWQAAEKIDPDNAALADSLGAAHLALGDAVRATAFLDRASKLEPANARYHFKLGNAIYLFRHELIGVIAPSEPAVLDRALEHLRKAAELEPQNAQYAAGYAETFYGIPQPDWSAALVAWRHVLEVSEDKDFAYVQLARVNLKLGHKKEARELVSKIQGKEFSPVKQRLLKQIGPE
jgi:tetratricopeptide (TPR) repeat protein